MAPEQSTSKEFELWEYVWMGDQVSWWIPTQTEGFCLPTFMLGWEPLGNRHTSARHIW